MNRKGPRPCNLRLMRLAGVAIAVVIAAPAAVADADPNSLGAFIRVVNADTLEFAGGRVQVAGIDAPEPPGHGPVLCPEEAAAGPAALEFAKDTLSGPGRDVRVTHIYGDAPEGGYERWLADVSVDGNDYGQILLDAGYGRHSPKNKRVWCPKEEESADGAR